jgi:hypothetical protein
MGFLSSSGDLCLGRGLDAVLPAIPVLRSRRKLLRTVKIKLHDVQAVVDIFEEIHFTGTSW